MDLTEGTEIPSFSRKASFDAWNRYAAVNDEFVPLHMDDDAGREAGFPGAIGMGNLSFSYLHCLLRGWMPQGTRIRSVEVNHRQPTLRGSIVTARGTIARVSDGPDGVELEIELTVDDDAGRVLIVGKAILDRLHG